MKKAILQRILCLIFAATLGLSANAAIVIGTVSDSAGEPLVGASVKLKSDAAIGTVTDIDGAFRLDVPDLKSGVLCVSYVGMFPKEEAIKGRSKVDITLSENSELLDEVVVVGYGQQKKASVVGAITQTSGETLQRSGGVTNVGSALTGNLPGVITMASSGLPGEEDPQIVIRAANSWNGSDPLVLVDGIEREMSSIDISSIESISVLKDASATAVYGVKGANGVILITTKRGQEGNAKVSIRANMTAKVASKLPTKYDAYDTFYLMNNSIEREAMLNAQGWGNYTPVDIIDKYRNPANDEEWDRYPNTDWEDALLKRHAMSYNVSVGVSGGTKLVKYFAAVDFTSEGDLFKNYENNRGYNSGFGYNRINARSNLDFNLTRTTQFTVNIFGSNATQKTLWAYSGSDSGYWASAYKSAPDAMRPIYSNGMWGWYAPRDADVPNSVRNLAIGGTKNTTTTRINSDFTLVQSLDMLVPGLNVRGRLSLDYKFVETDRGINDLYHDGQFYWVDPNTGDVHLKQAEPNTGLGLWADVANAPTLCIDGIAVESYQAQFDASCQSLALKGDATLYYTIDGSDPVKFTSTGSPSLSSSAIRANQSIELTTDCVIKARMRQGNKSWGPLLERQLTISKSTELQQLSIDSQKSDGTIYNMLGQPVSNPKTGIYIQDNKLKIIKR